jgi:hypothetical protein
MNHQPIPETGESQIMLYIITVHYKEDRWIKLQRHKLEQHVSQQFRLHACMEGISEQNAQYFDKVVPAVGPHAGKLNLLATDICGTAAGTDLLMFLDGDAFPVADPMPLIYNGLKTHDLVAVRRSENDGDRQPHPMFCVTTVELWRRIHGDWSEGYPWRNNIGELVTDVGGNLIWLLESIGANWLPIERTHSLGSHPVAFGVYGGIIYHQGGGFRKMITRADYAECPIQITGNNKALRRIQSMRYRLWLEQRARETEAVGEAIYRKLTCDLNYVESQLADSLRESAKSLLR